MTTVLCSDGPVMLTTIDAASVPFSNLAQRDGKLSAERWRQFCCHLAQSETPEQCDETITFYCDTFGLKPKIVTAMLRTYAPGLLP